MNDVHPVCSFYILVIKYLNVEFLCEKSDCTYSGKHNLNVYWNGYKLIDLQWELYAKVTRGTLGIQASFVFIFSRISFWLILGEEFGWKKSFNKAKDELLPEQAEERPLLLSLHLLYCILILIGRHDSFSFFVCTSAVPSACGVTSIAPRGTHQDRSVLTSRKDAPEIENGMEELGLRKIDCR